MTRDRFLTYLGLLPGRGYIPSVSCEATGMIRLRKPSKGGETFCPVTAVAYEITGEWYPTNDFIGAAHAIGLRRKTARAFAATADRAIWSRTTSPAKRRLMRKQLLALLGLPADPK